MLELDITLHWTPYR